MTAKKEIGGMPTHKYGKFPVQNYFLPLDCGRKQSTFIDNQKEKSQECGVFVRT
jgi:hypothetical protein